jgi:hypothetical protein
MAAARRAKRDALKQDLNNVVAARVLEWPTDSYEKALGICRMFKMFKSHATATAYLRSLLSPKEVPSDVVAEKGPRKLHLHVRGLPRHERTRLAAGKRRIGGRDFRIGCDL